MVLNQWNQRLTTEDTDEIIHQLATWHLEQVISRCSQFREISAYIAYRDVRNLVEFELEYGLLNSNDAYHMRQCLAFFQKRADYDLGIDKEAVAIRKFWESEALCRETNDIIRAVHSGGFCFPPDVNGVLHTTQRKIASILGDVPDLSELKFRFGPGATTQIQKRQASARNKLSQTFACSRDLTPILETVLGEVQGWLPEGESDSVLVPVEIVDGTLTSVPKNAKTNRCIVVEPSLNSFVQLGVGDYMTRRLKRFGVDLSDQTRNQRLAREGSLTGELATLDLSSASDTVARALIRDLLPLDWCDLIFQVSTSVVAYKGESISLEKVSSMGNGITFPLESLLFYALAVSCCETQEERDKVSVYGDDIIIPTHRYDILCKVLHCIGFIPNREKSYSSGFFRESCGKDYLSGIDIRPVYLKDRVTGADAFVLHNYYVRTWQPEPASIVLSYISPTLRLYGPDGYGDGHLLGDYSPIRKKKHIKNGFGGHIFDTFIWEPRRSFAALPGDRVLPSYTVYANPAKAGLPGIDMDSLNSYFPSKRSVFYDIGPSSVSYRRNHSSFGVMLPGTKGYKRISIYTLNPSTTLTLV